MTTGIYLINAKLVSIFKKQIDINNYSNNLDKKEITR